MNTPVTQSRSNQDVPSIASLLALIAFAPTLQARISSSFCSSARSAAANWQSEHKSSNPSTVNPPSPPDSQRIYFQSDREGKPVLYGMAIERLVEKTESEDEEATEKR